MTICVFGRWEGSAGSFGIESIKRWPLAVFLFACFAGVRVQQMLHYSTMHVGFVCCSVVVERAVSSSKTLCVEPVRFRMTRAASSLCRDAAIHPYHSEYTRV